MSAACSGSKPEKSAVKTAAEEWRLNSLASDSNANRPSHALDNDDDEVDGINEEVEDEEDEAKDVVDGK